MLGLGNIDRPNLGSPLALSTTIILPILGLLIYICRNRLISRGGRLTLPPGPTGLPLLGNMLQVPRTHLATHFRSLIKQYGGLVSLNIAGLAIILIGDFKLAKELLDKHSAKHSSRLAMKYFTHYVNRDSEHWVSMPSGTEAHRLGRKLTAGIMTSVRAGKTEALQEFEALLNLQLLLDDGGKDWFRHVERTSASVMLSAAFGMHCPTGTEPELRAALETIKEEMESNTPTASIINAFPFLNWIPGPTPWRVKGQAVYEHQRDVYSRLIDHAGRCTEMGIDTWTAHFSNQGKREGDQRRLIKTFATAAIETTSGTLHTFVLACILYPEWVSRAQKQIDKIIGPDRIPFFKDRPVLPYVEAVVREALRWRPGVRFGIPHQSTADDVIEYRGKEYFIPKGSAVFAVAWAIEHNESIYEDHDRFMPERFLDSDGNLKNVYNTSAFGFGRRQCPGIPFAERSLFINIALMLWAFNIKRSEEPDPKTGLPFQYDDSDAAFNGDLTNPPFKFPAVFEPRSSQRAEVARREWAECERDFRALLPTARDKD